MNGSEPMAVGMLVEATEAMAPLYFGLVALMAISIIGILSCTPLPRRIRGVLARRRVRTLQANQVSGTGNHRPGTMTSSRLGRFPVS